MNVTENLCYFDTKKPDTSQLLGRYLFQSLRKQDFLHLPPVFLCIGSNRVTGDSLGPMVGSSLKKKYQKSIPVYGTLEMPVHALNLESAVCRIRREWQNHPVIAVDASFGSRQHLGYITAGKGSLHPGAGVDKSLLEVGDFFVTGIVAAFTPFSHLALQTMRPSSVIPLAASITDGISLMLDASLRKYQPVL